MVTDGSRFVLLPASRELRDLNGRTVGVSRDHQADFVLRLRIGAWSGDTVVRGVAVSKTDEWEWTPKRLRKAVAAGTKAEKVALLKEIGVLRKDGTLARRTRNWRKGPTRTPELEG